MKIEQLYTNCLAEAAYYIQSEGEAAIIDPLRETEQYVEMAKGNNAKIKYIIETHFHADFVSGHIDLAEKTGATIIYGPLAETDFDCHVAEDSEVLKLGKISFTILHTPGHTMESSTYLLKDESGKDVAIFTGDTLFIGDVGRPDLAIGNGMTQEDLAGKLYDSLRAKIMPLSDDVIVYPAHGPGSACGKNMSKETFSTLGEQKKNNYALQDITREEFVKELTTGILPAPQYFSKDAMLNKSGYESYDNALNRGNIALSVEVFEKKMNDGALVLDTRKKGDFTEGYIPNSMFIGLDGTFAPWVGVLIEDIETPIILITDEGREAEAVTRLSRVGYDNAQGYLKGGFNAWKTAGKPVEMMRFCSSEELRDLCSSQQSEVIDVRKPGEYETAHLQGAKNLPLDFINEGMNMLDKEKSYYLHCKSGYRSLITASILKRNGFKNITDVHGGFDAISKLGLPLVESELAD